MDRGWCFFPAEDTAAVEGRPKQNQRGPAAPLLGDQESGRCLLNLGRSDSDREPQESREEGAEGVLGSFRDVMEKLQDGGEHGCKDRESAFTIISGWSRAPTYVGASRKCLGVAGMVRQRLNGPKVWMGSDRRRALHSALHGWSEEGSCGCCSICSRAPDLGSKNLHLVHEMAHRWAESDRTAAMEWGASQGDAAIRSRAMGGVVSSWAEIDPAAAASFASTIDNLFVKHQALEIAARRWASQDTASAMEWAQGLGGVDRHRATQSILRGVAENAPGKSSCDLR